MLTANGNDTVPASLPSNPVYESFDKPTKTTAAKSAVEPKENPVSKGEKASQMRTTSQRGANSRSNKKNRKAHDDAGYSGELMRFGQFPNKLFDQLFCFQQSKIWELVITR